MSRPLTNLVRPVEAKELARKLGLPFGGADTTIFSVAPLREAGRGQLTYSRGVALAEVSGSTIIATRAPESTSVNTSEVGFIQSATPRLTFARALYTLHDMSGFEMAFEAAEVHKSAQLESSVKLGHNVTIGKDTFVGHHAVIGDNVTIGEGCWIKPHAVIGEAGFGFERSEEGIPIRIMHLGGVIIGNHVEIGSFTTVCRATLGMTVIGNDSKIDDHVHIAHNARIGERVLIAANAEISGSVVVGDDVWISPSVCTRDNITIGNKAFLGLGAVVVKNVDPEMVMVGNPAKPLEKRS